MDKTTKNANALAVLNKRSVTQLKGIGVKLAEKLAKLGIHSQADFLFHLPLRYEDRTTITPLAMLSSKINNGERALIEATVLSTAVVFGRRRSLQCVVKDETSTATLRFFHFNAYQKEQLTVGTIIRCFGEVKLGKKGVEIFHPEYQIMARKNEPLSQTLTPIYPLTEGVTQKRIRQAVDVVLAQLSADTLANLVPADIEQSWHLPNLYEALQTVHSPDTQVDTARLIDKSHPCCQRLIMEELVAQHLTRLQARAQHQQRQAPAIQVAGVLGERLRQQLPFTLTQAQERVIQELLTDMQTTTPALRLVQGDVGSGKTVVAAFVALAAIEAGFQVALLAPTELLSEQHYLNFQGWFASLKSVPAPHDEDTASPAQLPLKTTWLTGKLTAKERRHALAEIQSGEANLVVGTHALFQEAVAYDNLALVIIDEQHRFGVQQRLALSDKSQGNTVPHQIIMTATPIPRTLAMGIYGDVAVSTIDEFPPGRQTIETHVMSHAKRDALIARLNHACKNGTQAYWVCTLIEDSEQVRAQAAVAVHEDLQNQLPDLTVGLLHGRMPSKEKQAVMHAFQQGDIDLLVATTVIEVGVDVPNASLMVIDNADRLGLAQLHQLRGRVGRGSQQSYCVLMYDSQLSAIARERLMIMRETTDGFVIAEHDLKQRGAGEVFGVRQTGALNFRFADIIRDQHLLAIANHSAERIYQQHPQHAHALIKRWLGESHHYQFV